MDYIISPGIGMQKKAAANKTNFFKVFEDFITGKIKLGENVNVKKLNPDLKTASLALQTLAANSGIMSRSSLRELLVQHPWYKKNQNIWKYATKVLSGDFKGKTFSDLQNFAEERIGKVKFKGGKLLTNLNPADNFIMKSALRHWDSVNRLQDPTVKNRIQFYYKGSKKPVDWKSLKSSTRGDTTLLNLKNVEFTLDGKSTRYNISNLKTIGPQAFPEVYEKTNIRNRILNKDVTDSKGKKVKLRNLVRKIFDKNKRFAIDLDHKDGVIKNPFTNLRVISSDLNNALGAVVNKSGGSKAYKKILAKEIMGDYSTLTGEVFEDALAKGSAEKMNLLLKEKPGLNPYQNAIIELKNKVTSGDLNLSKKNTSALNASLFNLKKVIRNLPKKDQLTYCSFLSRGGLPGDCAAAIDNNPVKAAQVFDQAPATNNAMTKVKNAATTFLKFAGKGKGFAIGAGLGVGGGALVKKFMNDDPSTYLTNDAQANAMILDTLDQKEREQRMEAIGDAPELLDEARIGGELAVTGAAIPGASSVYQARRKPFTRIVDGVKKTRPAMGPARAALGPVGKALSGFATPLGIAALTPLNVASSLYQGDSGYEIATDPLNYLAPALAGTMGSLSKEATRGMGATSKLAKTLRLGMSPGAIKMISRRFGLPGLALSSGISLYELADEYKSGRGIFGKKE